MDPEEQDVELEDGAAYRGRDRYRVNVALRRRMEDMLEERAMLRALGELEEEEE